MGSGEDEREKKKKGGEHGEESRRVGTEIA
jgi:hypothetical protein